MHKSIAVVALLSAFLLAACDEGPEPLTPEELEAITDLELLPPEEHIDPNAPEPEDEQPVDNDHPDHIQAAAQSDGPNPSNVPWTISPGTTCFNDGHCDSGERCDVVSVPGVSVRRCVGTCSTDDDCQIGETCGNDNYCDVLLKGDWDFCENGGCLRGHGDCEDDVDCTGSLECMLNNGSAWGYSGGTDVCDYPAGHAAHCSVTHPCVTGRGDCDSFWECEAGNLCKENRGGEFGFASWVDVCLLPWQ